MTRLNRANFRGGRDAGAISPRSSRAGRPVDTRDAGRPGLSVARSSLPQASDDTLIALAASGNQAAWAAIVGRHLSSLVGYAWYVLQESTEAEDVAQEAFVRLLDKAPDWRPGEASLSTWLHRVVTNLCIDRKRRLRRLINDAYARLESVPERDSLEANISRTKLVERALAELKPRQRVAIVLAHYQGFSNPEIAQIMGSSVEAVESLLARARLSLREILGPVVAELLESS